MVEFNDPEMLQGYIAENGLIVTPAARGAFVSVHRPQKNKLEPDKDPTYQVTLLFTPKTDLSIMKAEAGRVAREKWGDKLNDQAFAQRIRSPFRDQGEFPDYEGYVKGCIFVRAGAQLQYKPQTKDASFTRELTEDELYSGVWLRAVLAPFAYDNPKNRGVSFGLRAVQKLADDTPFAGGGDASKGFKPVAGATPAARPAASAEGTRQAPASGASLFS
jgi:hypothetical protein